MLNFTVVSIFIENVVASTDVGHWFVLGLLEANRYTGTRKMCPSITLHWGPTSNSAGLWRGLLLCHDISQLHSESTLAGLPSQPAVLGKVLQYWLKGQWNICASLLKLRLKKLQNLQLGQSLTEKLNGEKFTFLNPIHRSR